MSVYKEFLADEEVTLHFGMVLAKALKPGFIVFLNGELGMGKTTLCQGILRGLGFSGRVKSPTYTLVENYTVSNLNVYHFDLYRIHDPEECLERGLDEYFSEDAVCLVEWGEKAENVLPTPDWQVMLQENGSGRAVTLTALSRRGIQCLACLSSEF